MKKRKKKKHNNKSNVTIKSNNISNGKIMPQKNKVVNNKNANEKIKVEIKEVIKEKDIREKDIREKEIKEKDIREKEIKEKDINQEVKEHIKEKGKSKKVIKKGKKEKVKKEKAKDIKTKRNIVIEKEVKNTEVNNNNIEIKEKKKIKENKIKKNSKHEENHLHIKIKKLKSKKTKVKLKSPILHKNQFTLKQIHNQKGNTISKNDKSSKKFKLLNPSVIIQALLVLVMLGCFAYIGRYYYYSFKEKSAADDLASMIEQRRLEAMQVSQQDNTNDDINNEDIYIEGSKVTPTPTSVDDTMDADTVIDSSEDVNVGKGELESDENNDTDSSEPKILYQYSDLYEYNNDLVGWLKIEGTNIDYPVVQATDNDFYLDKGIDKEYARGGSLFVDSTADLFEDRSTNLIIYGHHMKDDSMFGTLFNYQDESFYEEHPTIQFDTIYEEGYYEVVSAFYAKIYNVGDKGFRYYQFIEAEDEEAFQSFIFNIKRIELYKTNVVPTYGDQLLTLSTCSYHSDNGRFVVVARKIVE